MTYKEKLLKEIEEIPEEFRPKFLRLIHILKREWIQKTKKTGIRGSLKGIWKGSQVDESLFYEARKSLFPYESWKDKVMDYVTDTHPIIWYFTEDPNLSEKALEVFEGTIKEGIIYLFWITADNQR